MIGSFAVLGAFLDIPAWQSFVQATGLQLILMTIQSLTLSLIALYVVLVLPFQYAQKLKINPITAAVLSLMAFLLLTPHELYTAIPTEWLDFRACSGHDCGRSVPALSSSYLTKRFIRMPKGVPTIVEDLCFLGASTIGHGNLCSSSQTHCTDELWKLPQCCLYHYPDTSAGLWFDLPAYLVMQILCTLLMFVGDSRKRHLSTFTPMTMAASAENLAAAGQALPNIVPVPSVFCQPGGIGGTFGLALLAFWPNPS